MYDRLQDDLKSSRVGERLLLSWILEGWRTPSLELDTEKCGYSFQLIFFPNCSFSSHSRSLSVLPSRKRSRCPSRCCCRLDFRLLRGRQKIGGRHRFCPIGVLKDALAAAFGRICSLTAAAIAQLLFCPRSLLRLRAWPARADASFCDLPFSRFSGRISQSGCAAASISQSGCGAAVGARLYAAFVALVPAAAVVRTKIRAVAAAASSGLTARCWLEVVARGGDLRPPARGVALRLHHPQRRQAPLSSLPRQLLPRPRGEHHGLRSARRDAASSGPTAWCWS